ncbi:MAG: hemolysin family protein [Anaerolineae bacterium]
MLWFPILLLALQAVLTAFRTVLTHPRREWDEERRLDLLRGPDITRLSASLDFLQLLATGVYFIVGFVGWSPLLSEYEQRLFPAGNRWFLPLTQALLVIILGWISLILGRLGPEAMGKALVLNQRKRVEVLTRNMHVLVQPFSRSALALGNLIARRFGGTPLERSTVITEEEIQSLVTAGEETGVIEEDAREMITSIFRLDDTITREVMVPRIDIVAIDVKSSPEDALARVVKSGHSRIPVYEQTIDHVIGILYAKDLLEFQCKCEKIPSLREILRPAHFIPEAKRLDNLLKELQETKVQIAIVVDEYGGVAGLVTLEDVVEEIVGEIQDEYDREEPEVVRAEDAYIFDGRIPLDDVQDLLHIPLPLEEVDSLGGFIYNELGHIPQVGERVTVHNVEFEVREISGRRIRKIKATPL